MLISSCYTNQKRINMTKKLLILLFFFGSFFMHAQNLVWRTNMTDAIAISNEQKKPMLILFTASGVPENLQNEIFKTPDFAVWSRAVSYTHLRAHETRIGISV